MYAEQVLSYPSTGATGAKDVKGPSPEEFGGVLGTRHERRRVRPRPSVDTFLGVVALVFAIALTNAGRIPFSVDGLLAMQLSVQDLILFTGFFFVWPRIFTALGTYETRRATRSDIPAVLMACTIGTVLASGFLFFGRGEMFTASTLGTFWVLSIAATLMFRGFAGALNTTIRSRAPRRVLIIGSGLRALKLFREISADPEGFELLGFVDDSDESASDDISRRMLGKLGDLESILMHQVVDEALIALPIKSCYTEIQRTIDVCARVGVESKYLADAFRASIGKPHFEHHRAVPLMTMKVFYDDYRVSIKRAIDFLAALFGLIVLAPVMLAIAAAIKLNSPGPVLFVQERYGLNKRRFRMYKFRTMVPNAEALIAQLEEKNEAKGPIFKMQRDPRVTPLGRWLRKTSLDELPQLINVLKGDMSLVGPRPMAVRDVQLFDQAWFMRRFSAPPGMTGLWQVSGRSQLGFDDWVALDLKYIDEWSLGLDLEILARTIPVVFRGTGAV